MFMAWANVYKATGKRQQVFLYYLICLLPYIMVFAIGGAAIYLISYIPFNEARIPLYIMTFYLIMLLIGLVSLFVEKKMLAKYIQSPPLSGTDDN